MIENCILQLSKLILKDQSDVCRLNNLDSTVTEKVCTEWREGSEHNSHCRLRAPPRCWPGWSRRWSTEWHRSTAAGRTLQTAACRISPIPASFLAGSMRLDHLFLNFLSPLHALTPETLKTTINHLQENFNMTTSYFWTSNLLYVPPFPTKFKKKSKLKLFVKGNQTT